MSIAWLLAIQVSVAWIAATLRTDDRAVAADKSVTYVLAWSRAHTRDLPMGAGIEITNDLGFIARVARAYIVTRGIELIPCTPVPPAALLRDSLDWLIAPRPAFAGHSAIADPSAIKSAVIETLPADQPTQIGSIPLGPQTYCQAHYLVARADAQASNLPKDLDMVDQTLHIEGAYRRRDSQEISRFSVTTAVANGKLFDLTPQLNTATSSAVVIVRRNLDTLFDRVDFATMPEKRIAREILQNLIDGTTIEVKVSGDAR